MSEFSSVPVMAPSAGVCAWCDKPFKSGTPIVLTYEDSVLADMVHSRCSKAYESHRLGFGPLPTPDSADSSSFEEPLLDKGISQDPICSYLQGLCGHDVLGNTYSLIQARKVDGMAVDCLSWQSSKLSSLLVVHLLESQGLAATPVIVGSLSGCRSAFKSWTAWGYLSRSVIESNGRPCFCYSLADKGRQWLQLALGVEWHDRRGHGGYWSTAACKNLYGLLTKLRPENAPSAESGPAWQAMRERLAYILSYADSARGLYSLPGWVEGIQSLRSAARVAV